MYIALPNLNCAKRKARALAAMIPANIGLITLAVENINSYLCRRRNEAMAKAMTALSNKQSQCKNMVLQFEDGFLMYGQPTLESTESIIESLTEMMRRQYIRSHNEKAECTHPAVYSDHALSPALYGYELQLYIQTMCERYANIWRFDS